MNWTMPYPSQRMPVFAKNVVATSQPLASQAGMRMLQRGGNAVDAALTTAIALTILEPCSNGIGSDAFAIVWDGKQLHGLNASGRSPQAWNPDRFKGLTRMPQKGWDCVTIPGAVSAWMALSKKLGKLPFADLFEPAIRYARDGYMVSPIIAGGWRGAKAAYRDFPEFGRTFLPGGEAPRAGEVFKAPHHAATLDEIAKTEGESFYRGQLADRIVTHARMTGGAMTLHDLATHKADWVDPIFADYHGVRIHEIPPNGQGLATLIALGILRHHDIRNFPVDSADSLHLQIEAMKLAFVEAHRHIADPAAMTTTVAKVLDDGYLKDLASRIRMDQAASPTQPVRGDQGTVYLCAADESGMMVSYIQSNFAGFGSGIVIPETGIALQNRGSAFSLDPKHPNIVAGGKRPYHTIIPGFATRDGGAVMAFGVMGGHMQPQGHLQMALRVFDYAQNPQAASDAPRWHVTETFELGLEKGHAPAIVESLTARGHKMVAGAINNYGGAQLIHRMDGGYCAASDHRKDGCAVGW